MVRLQYEACNALAWFGKADQGNNEGGGPVPGNVATPRASRLWNQAHALWPSHDDLFAKAGTPHVRGMFGLALADLALRLRSA